MMTGAVKWALFALVLMQAVKCTRLGYSTTSSYEELLAAVKSGRFTVEKADIGKGNNQDILQEILDKSKFCFIQLDYVLPRPNGGTLKRKHIKLKNRLLVFSISSLKALTMKLIFLKITHNKLN